MENKPSVSVVTVAFQAAETIERTIQSVLHQNYDNFEYIIVDGCSTDGTIELIEHYKEFFNKKGIRYIYISESDNGIYDAMNKAIQYCKNEWIIYINANDCFYSDDVLTGVFENDISDEISCIYGTTMNSKHEKKYFKRNYPIETSVYRSAFVHQALFVKKEVIKKYPFNLRYRIYADQDQFVRMYVAGEKFKRIDVLVANFDLCGVSQDSQNYKEFKNEMYDIWKENGVLKKTRLRRFWRVNVVELLKSNYIIRNLYINFISRLHFSKVKKYPHKY